METVQHLAARGTRFFVPLGIGAHLERWGVPLAQIEEMEWWQRSTLGGVRVRLHADAPLLGPRPGDRSTTLWSSWSVLGPQHRFFYSGDTGYWNALPGDRRRASARSTSPSSRSAPTDRGSHGSTSTCRPSRPCRRTATCARSGMFPVHWSTFNLAYHDWDEPIRRTVAEARRTGVELVTPRLGEWVDADGGFASTPWWEGVR